MKISLFFGAIAVFPAITSAKASPPAGIAEYCSQKGQIAQQVKGVWKCVQISDICGPGEDTGTIHSDKDTGEWVCCLKGYVVKDGRCVKPAPECPPLPTGLCKSPACANTIKSPRLESLLREAFTECFPHDEIHLDSFIQYQINSLETGINLFEKIHQDKKEIPKKRQSSPPSAEREWWNCSFGGLPCKWLGLENDNIPKKLVPTGHERMTLPNPNKQVSHYRFPFDMWATKLEGQLTLYIKGKQVQPHGSGRDFLIPAGTSSDDISYKSETGAKILFHGSCSAYTPCIRKEVVPWTRGVSNNRPGQNGEIYVGHYDTDLVLTIADTETTSEQYTVFADGVKIGTTHGRLTLGEEKYKRANIHMIDVGSGAAGALQSIANNGFWGSFKIPAETRRITVVDESSDFDFAFEYRLDKACSC